MDFVRMGVSVASFLLLQLPRLLSVPINRAAGVETELYLSTSLAVLMGHAKTAPLVRVLLKVEGVQIQSMCALVAVVRMEMRMEMKMAILFSTCRMLEYSHGTRIMALTTTKG
jgi:hypothetical protein